MADAGVIDTSQCNEYADEPKPHNINAVRRNDDEEEDEEDELGISLVVSECPFVRVLDFLNICIS
jgi:NADPH-dependent 7-cyano-7-deazaguanine reductase QueF